MSHQQTVIIIVIVLYFIYLTWLFYTGWLVSGQLCHNGGFSGGSVVKNPPAKAGEKETQVPSLCQEDLQEEEMATHCSILVWKSLGQRSLWATVHGVVESNTTEWLSMHTDTCHNSWKWRLIFVSFIIWHWEYFPCLLQKSSLGDF